MNSSSHDFDPIQFGVLQQRVENLTEAVDRLDAAVDRLSSTISETRGGWKMLVTLGSVVAGISAAVTWAVSHVKLIP